MDRDWVVQYSTSIMYMYTHANGVCMYHIVYIVDGSLSHKEFIRAMKSRTTRGLEKVHKHTHTHTQTSRSLGVSCCDSGLYTCMYNIIQWNLSIRTPLN